MAERLRKIAPLTGYELVLFVIDVDGLEQVDQTFGLQERDLSLMLAADTMRDAFGETDVVARIGANQFAVAAVTPGSEDPSVRADELRRCIELGNMRRGGGCKISAQVGFASTADYGEQATLDQLIDAAKVSPVAA